MNALVIHEGPATGTDSPCVEDALAEARRHLHEREFKQAEQVCREILKLQPRHPEALNLLAETTHGAGAPGVALALARRAVALDPTKATYHCTLGNALLATGWIEEAEATLRRALDLNADHTGAIGALATTLIARGRIAEAHVLVKDAIERKPENPALYQLLGVVLVWLAEPAEARASFQRAGELFPDYFAAESGALFAGHYVLEPDAALAAAEARAWAARHADKHTPELGGHRNSPDPHRRLRIGYLSGDFRIHPVGRIAQSVIPNHDPAHVEVYCYSNHRVFDDVTRQLQTNAVWRSVVHLSDQALANLIRDDEIDVLVDLSGHTAEGRLMTLARKPAPVQAMWLGYFDTTGMAAVDYMIADRYVCPPGDEHHYVEQVARLPHSFLCFTPPDDCPDVARVGALDRGYVTFGCLNNAAKVTPQVASVWARILAAVPDSRLFLKAIALSDPVVSDRYRALFAEFGIAADRLEFVGSSPYREYLESYAQVDIALDPFPYNGGHTTMDALWMGVPVVTLRGNHFVGRMGTSILSTLRLDELVASSVDDYVRAAVALAQDTERLKDLRAGLRERMAASPLCDGPGMARALETIFREGWRAWCKSVSR